MIEPADRLNVLSPMRDRLWETTWRISVAAFAAALVAAVVFWVLGRPLDGVGLLVGAAISSVNFLATGAFLRKARDMASSVQSGHRAAFRFIMRYLFIGALLVVLTLGVGLPAVTTVLGVAAVPLTIYLWQMGRLVTGRWKTPSA